MSEALKVRVLVQPVHLVDTGRRRRTERWGLGTITAVVAVLAAVAARSPAPSGTRPPLHAPVTSGE